MYGSNATAFGKSSTTKKPYTAGHTNSSLAGSVRTKKKIEGYDGGQSRADPHSRMMESGMSQGYRASQIGNNFSQNVERLKNQGGKQVEEEYIKALQEEIKILEYQMKILKDKEIEQQAAVSQIDKFFSDGVPLNPNILALKSQYQNKKSEEQRVIETMRKRIMEFEKNALDLEDEIKYHQENRGKLENEKNMTEDDIKKVIDE